MAINKVTPRYLNKDIDKRYLKQDEAFDMVNADITRTDEGNEYVIKPHHGTRLIANAV